VAGTPKAGVTANVAGASLILTRGFLAVAAMLLLSTLLPTGFADVGNWLGGLAFVLIYAGSISLHESAHALAAVQRGFQITSMRLTWTGGETHYEGEADDGIPPRMVAGAGILASALAAAVLVTIVVLEGTSGHPGGWTGYATFAAEVNILLTVVNALPLPGSDGHYLLRQRGGAGRAS